MNIPIISELLLRRRMSEPEDPGTESEDFSWVIQTTTPNEQYGFALATYADGIANVDWGDGSATEDFNSVETSSMFHIYEEAGLYTISVSGQHSAMCIYPGYHEAHRNKVITALNMNLPGYLGNSNTSLGEFKDCQNLTSFGPNFKFASTITNLVNTFNTCGNLVGVIPKLPSDFNGSLNSTFKYCGKLTGFVTGFTIPTNVTDLTHTFNGCLMIDRLVSIPQGYSGSLLGTFRDCREVTTLPVGFVIPDNTTNLTQTFRGCLKLTEIPLIPSGFTGQAGYTFQSCTSLVTLPTGFSIPNNSSVNIPGLFQDCTSLTEIPIIPPLYRGSLDYTFKNCSSLGLLPEGFAIPKVSSLVGTFDGCTSMAYLPISIASDFVGSMQNCFNNCRSVYHELPDNFAIPAGVTSLQNTFSNCSSLTEIPLIPSGYSGNLISTFENCTGLVGLPVDFTIPSTTLELHATFKGCTGLVSLPSTFTLSHMEFNSFRYMFQNCTELVSLPANFRLTTNAMNGDFIDATRMFQGCSKLATIPTTLFDSTGGGSTITFFGTFAYCSALTNLPLLPQQPINLEGAFANCASITQFPTGFKIPGNVTNLNSTFINNLALEEIPATIWPSDDYTWGNTDIDISYMFFRHTDQSTKPIGTIPSELWTTYASIFLDTTYAFFNCSSLTNYVDIPGSWK